METEGEIRRLLADAAADGRFTWIETAAGIEAEYGVEWDGARPVIVNRSVVQPKGKPPRPPGTVVCSIDEWIDYWRRTDPSWLGVVNGRLREFLRPSQEGERSSVIAFRDLPDDRLPDWIMSRRRRRSAGSHGRTPNRDGKNSGPETDTSSSCSSSGCGFM